MATLTRTEILAAARTVASTFDSQAELFAWANREQRRDPVARAILAGQRDHEATLYR
jgi:hypothetical protein